MKRILLILILISAIRYPSLAMETSKPGGILIISYASADTLEANLLLRKIQPLADRLECDISIFNITLGKVTSQENLKAINDSIRKYYPVKPRLVISYMEPAWQICRDLFDHEWKDVPAIIYMGNDRMVKDIVSMISSKSPYELTDLIPTQDAVKGYNVTMIDRPLYYSATVALMTEVLPDIKTIALITDERHVSKIEQLDFRNRMKKEYPRMEIEILSYPAISTDMLMDTVSRYDKSVGIIYFGWNTSINRSVTRFDDIIHKVISAISNNPIFNVYDKGIDNNDLGGGAYITSEEMAQTCAQTASKILENGIQPRDIPSCVGGKQHRFLNYPILVVHGIDILKRPSKAIYHNIPPTVWDKYKYYLIAGFAILAIMFMLVLLLLRSKAKESALMAKHNSEISALNRRLEIIIKAAKMNVWSLDVSSRELAITYDFLNGKKIEDEAIKLTTISKFYQAVHSKDVEIIQNGYLSLLNGTQSFFDREYRLRLPGEDNYKWVETYAAVNERDPSGTPITIVGASILIDDRKKMESMLREEKEKAEKANKMKNQFIANMSHEIRTPLNAIVGFSGFLASGTCSDEEKKEYTSIIEKNNALLLQLVNDILELSVIESETAVIPDEQLDVSGIVQGVYESALLRNRKTEVTLQTMLPETPVMAAVDKDKITQVFNHLISNALKFTNMGSVTIGYEDKKDYLYFYVLDTGPGIPEKDQSSIFERFIKLNTFTQGTGLGLPIAKSLTEVMGGTIGVDSREGMGSKFWFTVPIV